MQILHRTTTTQSKHLKVNLQYLRSCLITFVLNRCFPPFLFFSINIWYRSPKFTERRMNGRLTLCSIQGRLPLSIYTCSSTWSSDPVTKVAIKLESVTVTYRTDIRLKIKSSFHTFLVNLSVWNIPRVWTVNCKKRLSMCTIILYRVIYNIYNSYTRSDPEISGLTL